MSDSVITFRVSKHNPDLVSKIKVLAHKDGRTLNNYVEKILLQHVRKEIKPLAQVNLKPDLIEEILNIFKKKYQEVYKHPYIEIKKGIDRSAVDKLILIARDGENIEVKNLQKTRDNIIYWLSIFFDKCLTINDPWLRANMSPSIMLSQYNRIMKILSQGNTRALMYYSYTEMCDIVTATKCKTSDFTQIADGPYKGKWIKNEK